MDAKTTTDDSVMKEENVPVLLQPKKKKEEEEKKKMRVTVLSGFLGAGKTTLLKHILRSNDSKEEKDRLRIALIVNDMGEINLDAEEIKNTKMVKEEAEMVELHNGCICCTLRGDLLKTVKSLSEENVFDYLVIESTGISEPLPVAQTFVMDVDGYTDNKGNAALTVAETEKKSLSHFATLDTMVSVVDALNIFDVLSSIEKLSSENFSGMTGNKGPSTKSGKEGEMEIQDDRSLAALMLDQIEFANVIVVSKAHLLCEKKNGFQKLDKVVALLKKLSPLARVVVPKKDKFKDLEVDKILINSGLFDMNLARQSAGWLRELLKEDHTPETEEYGISSLIFRNNDMPFHPQRLFDILKGFGDYESALKVSTDLRKDQDVKKIFEGVVRTKGRIWLANCNAVPMEVHTAGRHLGVQPVGTPFLAAIPKEKWNPYVQGQHDLIKKHGLWSPTFGDRRSELVFIGVGLRKELITKKLLAALLTEEESKALGGMDGWRTLNDPFFGGIAAKNWFELGFN